jgi:hypothetical protein
MQPIVRPAARYAGPEQDMKLLNRDVWKFERPVDHSPAFSFFSFFSDIPLAHQQGARTRAVILNLALNQVQGLRFLKLGNGSNPENVDPDPKINSA